MKYIVINDAKSLQAKLQFLFLKLYRIEITYGILKTEHNKQKGLTTLRSSFLNYKSESEFMSNHCQGPLGLPGVPDLDPAESFSIIGSISWTHLLSWDQQVKGEIKQLLALDLYMV